MRTQLQIVWCALQGTSVTAGELGCTPAMQEALVVWQAVQEPRIAEQVSAASASVLASAVARIAQEAERSGLTELGARLAGLLATLSARGISASVVAPGRSVEAEAAFGARQRGEGPSRSRQGAPPTPPRAS